MSQAPGDARHLTYSNLDLLWDGGAPLILPVEGSPQCELRFDPPARQITLVTDYQTPEPDLARLQNITYEAVCADGRDVAMITVRANGGVHGAYGLLSAIADELQLKKSSLSAAVVVGVNNFKEILSAKTGLTLEEEIGLFGELLFLDFIMAAIGAGPAIAAWQGPNSEEHDFTFQGIDLEVKTTTSEDRRHTITGLNQLIPRPDVPLTLLSIQITRVGDDEGNDLPGLITRVRSSAAGHIVALDARLERNGWDSNEADLYLTRWSLRSKPRAYSVGSNFPSITADVLRSAITRADLISDVSYRVDVTDLQFAELPQPFTQFAETEVT